MSHAARTTGKTACALAAVLLLALPVGAEPFALAVLGDSISDTYFLKISLTERSWTDQLRLLHKGRIKLDNQASAGSTSIAMLSQRQPEKAAQLVRQGKVRNVCLIIGGNDLGMPLLIPGGLGYLDTAAAKLVENITQALDTIQAAGPAAVVLGNVPDLGDTPFFRPWAESNPAQAARLTRLTAEVNRRLAQLAADRGIPLVDLHGLVHLSRRTVHVGGIDVSRKLYTSEGLHPSTISSALIGNTILEAFRVGYSSPVADLQLSDREILAEVGQTAASEERFNVSPFVIFPRPGAPTSSADGPTPSTGSFLARAGWLLLLPGVVLLGLAGYWLWRGRRKQVLAREAA